MSILPTKHQAVTFGLRLFLYFCNHAHTNAKARIGDVGNTVSQSVFIREAVRGQSVLICGEVSWVKYPCSAGFAITSGRKKKEVKL